MISMLIGLEVSSLACKCVYFTDQNIMQEGEPMKLNFEGLKLQKWNIPTDEKVPIDRKVDEKKWGHLFSYHISSRSYGH